MITEQSRKSGKGLSDGVVSELTTLFTVKPGHADQLRAACQTFIGQVRGADAMATQKSGLRDVRLVMFDNDQRLLLTTTFETDWDPYIDDAIMLIGPSNWFDLFQYLVEYTGQGMADKSFAAAKRFLQENQVQASAYWNALSDKTVPQIRKAVRIEQAFQQVLDDPAAAQPLQQPVLKPLLQEAAD
jgi:hypothetical protein